MNDARLAKHRGNMADGFFWSCQRFLKSIKMGLQQRPHVNTLALTNSPFFTPEGASGFLLPLTL